MMSKGVSVRSDILAKLLRAGALGLDKHDSSIVLPRAAARSLITFLRFACLTCARDVRDFVTSETAGIERTME